jgi:hypothetical protein
MKAGDQDSEKENHSNEETPLPAVSANTLARCLGVSPKAIYDLAKAGVIERGAGRLFRLEDSVRRYCEHLRRQRADRLRIGPSTGSLSDEDRTR